MPPTVSTRVDNGAAPRDGVETLALEAVWRLGGDDRGVRGDQAQRGRGENDVGKEAGDAFSRRDETAVADQQRRLGDNGALQQRHQRLVPGQGLGHAGDQVVVVRHEDARIADGIEIYGNLHSNESISQNGGTGLDNHVVYHGTVTTGSSYEQ